MNLFLKRFLKNAWALTEGFLVLLSAVWLIYVAVTHLMVPAVKWLASCPTVVTISILSIAVILFIALLTTAIGVDLSKEKKDEKAPRKDGPELG